MSFAEIATPRLVGARNDTLSFVTSLVTVCPLLSLRGAHLALTIVRLSCHSYPCEALFTFVIARSETTKQSHLVPRSELRKADSARLSEAWTPGALAAISCRPSLESIADK